VPASAGGPQPARQDHQTLRDDTAGSGAARVPERTSNTSRWSLEPVPGGAGGRYPRRQALRVLLTATVLGRSVSFLSQIVEIATAREKLRRPVSGTRPPPPCWALHGATRCRPPPARR